MVTKEKFKSGDLIGKLCLHRKSTVLVIAEFKREIKASDNITLPKSYWVLFPHAGIDVVSEKALKIIK
jgi:hypothetical protein